MFSPKNTDTPNPFRPALQYLLSTRPRSNHSKNSSSGSLDSEPESSRSRMFSNSRSSTDYRNAPSIPLINISRSPSPFPRRHSGSNPVSDSDDDDWGDSSSTRHPFLPNEPRKLTGWNALLRGGGLGQFIFTTSAGWQLYIALLVFWLGGCEIGLILMNRIILWSGYLKENYTSHTKLMEMIAGVYKFRYPLTTTFFEMLITHGFVLLSAYITRLASPWLISSGLSGMIAPSHPLQSLNAPGFRGQGKNTGGWGSVSRWTSSFSGGIAGGGLFEFDFQVVKQVLPVAIVFVVKLSLSNLSFVYAELPIYVLARIGIVPISLLLTALLTQTPPSVSVVSSAVIATLTLLVATARGNVRVPWESIVAGVFSSFFVALYPIQLSRTYKSLLTSLVPQGELLGTFPSQAISSLPPDHSGTKEEARAYWRLLHYTSVISIIIFLPIVFFSGEIGDIRRNCYILDVGFHWLMVLCGGLGSWAVFWSTIALTRSTSPLTTCFLFVPRAAFLLPIMAGFKMPAYSWIGIGMCWASCAWFVRGRCKEGRVLGGLR
jgi:hypothetical protein